jgi:hypothetical protein
LEGGEIQVLASFNEGVVNYFEYSDDKKFNPTFGELMKIKAFHK